MPFYVVGIVLLLSSGILFVNQLPNQPFDSISNDTTQPAEISTQELQPGNSSPIARATVDATLLPSVSATSAPARPPVPSDTPIGKIVFTCQIFRDNNRNQICMMNGDGTDQRRLTTDDSANHFYPSLAPDGKHVVFTSNQAGADEIFEMDLSGNQTQLTFLGNVYAPEISPDGRYIVFSRVEQVLSSLWIMDRDGSNPRRIFGKEGFEAVDPTWSPDGQEILFAHGKGDAKKLYTVDVNGDQLEIVSEDFITRGRSDWSPDGSQIAGYTGDRWQRQVYLMNNDGSHLFQLFGTGNVQAPSFSPDGGWVTFTGYLDNMRNSNGCEIYIMRLTSGEPERLTNNDYCDWQPRWGQ
jgi:TolB protein